METSISPEEIVTYYDQCEIDYKWLWHLDGFYAMHYGYWKEDTVRLRDALDNMNQFVTSKLQLEAGDMILDAGCGVGGTSIYISKRFAVKTHGITLSKKQVDSATKNASKQNVANKSTFSVQSYCETNFANETFDKAFGIESICHANDKSEFLNEAFRVLKPGGRLVVADFFASGPYENKDDQKLMDNWADSWAVPSFETWQNFIDKAATAGFTLAENNHISDKIMKSAKRLYYCFFPGIFFHTIARMLFLRNKVQGKNVWSTYYQYKSLQQHLWEYRVMTFIKN